MLCFLSVATKVSEIREAYYEKKKKKYKRKVDYPREKNLIQKHIHFLYVQYFSQAKNNKVIP